VIPTSISALLEPLETFESIRRDAARLGHRLCDLSYANPYPGPQHGAVGALREALDSPRLLGLQYTPFGGQTLARRLVADGLRRSHELGFAYRDVILTPGAMSALHLALLAANAPGGEVIVPTPCWLDVPVYVRHAGATPVMVFPDADARLDLEAIGAAITAQTRAIVLAHPSNPTGHHLSASALAELAAVLEARARDTGATLTLIADETHRDFTPEGGYHSLAREYPRTLLAYSFGKYHFLQGQRLGYAAVSPAHPERAEIAHELERWTRITGIATPTALMQQALPRLLTLRYDLSWLPRLRRRMASRLRAAGYRVADADATLFLYVRTPDGISDWSFTRLLAGRGVLVLPAPVFHHRGWFRLALTASEPMIETALSVLEEEATACTP
jgi:aspartate aminotransferase